MRKRGVITRDRAMNRSNDVVIDYKYVGQLPPPLRMTSFNAEINLHDNN